MSLFQPFLLFGNSCADNSTAADKQQRKPQHEATVVAGLRRPRFVRQLSRYGVGFFDFLGAVLITVILIAVIAAPIFEIALGVLGRRLCVNMLEAGVIVRVEFAVSLSAVLAYRSFGAGRLAAGAILCFKPAAAVRRALTAMRAVAV